MKVGTWLLIVAVLAVLAILELTFGLSQAIVLAVLPPSVTSAPAPAKSPLTEPVDISLIDDKSSEIIFRDNNPDAVLGLSKEVADGVWDHHGRHELVICFGRDETFRTTSFVTTLWHLKRRVTMFYFHPFKSPTTYAQALAGTRKLLEAQRMADRVDWSEYDRDLDRKPITPFVPVIEFTSARMRVSLGCTDWNDAISIRAQFHRVRCFPDIRVEAKTSR